MNMQFILYAFILYIQDNDYGFGDFDSSDRTFIRYTTKDVETLIKPFIEKVGAVEIEEFNPSKSEEIKRVLFYMNSKNVLPCWDENQDYKSETFLNNSEIISLINGYDRSAKKGD